MMMRTSCRPGALLALAVSLLSLAACGTAGASAPTATPISRATALAAPSLPVLPQPVRSGVPQPVLSAMPPPLPSGVSGPPLPTWTPVPTPLPPTPHGDNAEAEAIVQKWNAAFQALHSFSASQQFMLVLPDGTRQAPQGDAFSDVGGSDEWYGDIGSHNARYRVVFHGPRGDFTTLYDGHAAYRTWSWLPDVFRAWPDSFAQNAYWSDDIDEPSLAECLRPAPVAYTLAGRSSLDGRAVVELTVKQGNVSPLGLSGTQIYLDTATWLPYRVVTHSSVGGKKPQPAFERTFSRLALNPPLTDADFALRPPPGPTTPIVVERADRAPNLPTYPSLSEAKAAAGFTLYAPAGRQTGAVAVTAYVDLGGKRTPILAVDSGNILEGVYLPVVTGDRFAQRFSSQFGAYQSTPLTVGGQPAEWRANPPGAGRLRLTRGGTVIEIGGYKQPDALALAASLQPVP